MQARFEMSQISRLDLLDQSNKYNNASNQLENLKDNYEQSFIEFKSSLNMEDENIEIEGLVEPEIWEITEAEALERAFARSNALKIAELDFKLSESQFEKNKIDASSSEQKVAELDLKAAEISLKKS